MRLTLDQGYDSFTYDVTISNDQISWAPDVGANWLSVAADGGSGTSKWTITGSPDNFAPPVTYGMVPAGAEQYWPFQGESPDPLATGDEVYIYGTQISDEGYTELYEGSGIVE